MLGFKTQKLRPIETKILNAAFRH